MAISASCEVAVSRFENLPENDNEVVFRYQGPRMSDYETKEQYFAAYQDFWLKQVSPPL